METSLPSGLMAGPAGRCEWCGGPQQWSIIADELYVRCVSGCLPLPLEGVTPPDSESVAQATSESGTEPPEEGGDTACEGSEARLIATIDREPPEWWLSSLWEGGPLDG